MQKESHYIIASSLLACTALYLVEQVLVANYAVKTLVKLLLFVAIPLLYKRVRGAERVIALASGSGLVETSPRSLIYLPKKKTELLPGLVCGLAAFLIVMMTFLLTRNAIDLAGIARELREKSGVTPLNFIFVGLYITFGNSFLEEYFFRGFVFLSLYQLGKPKLAYIYSALLFAVYHIAIFQTWFSAGLIALALVGLIGVGVILSWLNVRSGHILNSWLTHILADAAIILIGMRMFSII